MPNTTLSLISSINVPVYRNTFKSCVKSLTNVMLILGFPMKNTAQSDVLIKCLGTTGKHCKTLNFPY